MEFATSFGIWILTIYVLGFSALTVLAQDSSHSQQYLYPSSTDPESFIQPGESTTFVRDSSSIQGSFRTVETGIYTSYTESSHNSLSSEELLIPTLSFPTTRVNSEPAISDFSESSHELFLTSSSTQAISSSGDINRSSWGISSLLSSTQRTDDQTISTFPMSENEISTHEHLQTDSISSISTADDSSVVLNLLTFSSNVFTADVTYITRASSEEFISQTEGSVFNSPFETVAMMTMPSSAFVDVSQSISVSDASSGFYSSSAINERSFIEPSMSFVVVETPSATAQTVNSSLISSPATTVNLEWSYLTSELTSSIGITSETIQSVDSFAQSSSLELLPSGVTQIVETQRSHQLTPEASVVDVSDSLSLLSDFYNPQSSSVATDLTMPLDLYPTQTYSMCSDCEQSTPSEFSSRMETLFTSLYDTPYSESDSKTYLFSTFDNSKDSSIFTQFYLHESSLMSGISDYYSFTTDSALSLPSEDIMNDTSTTISLEKQTLTTSFEQGETSTMTPTSLSQPLMTTYTTHIEDLSLDSSVIYTEGFSTNNILISLSTGKEHIRSETSSSYIISTPVYQTTNILTSSQEPVFTTSAFSTVAESEFSIETLPSYQTEIYSTLRQELMSSSIMDNTTTSTPVVTLLTDVILTFSFVSNCQKLSQPPFTEKLNKKFLSFIVNTTHILDKGSISVKRFHCSPNWIPVTFHNVDRKHLLRRLNTTFSTNPKGMSFRITADKETITVNLTSFRELIDKPIHTKTSSKLLNADVAVIATASCICVILVAVGLFVFIREIYCKKVSERFNFTDSSTIPLKTENVALASLPKHTHTSVYNDLEMAEERSVDIDEAYNNSYDADYSTIGANRRTSFNDGTKSDLNIKTDEEEGASSPETERNSSSNLLRPKDKKPETDDDTNKLTSEKSERRQSRGYGLVIGLMGYSEKKPQKDKEQKPEEENNCYAMPKKTKKGIKNAAATPPTPPSEHAPSPAPTQKSPAIDSPIPPARHLRDAHGKKGVTDSYENLLPGESHSEIKDPGSVSDARGVDNPSFVAEKKEGNTGSIESFHF